MIVRKRPLRTYRSVLFKNKIISSVCLKENKYLTTFNFYSSSNGLFSKESIESIRIIIKRIIRKRRLLMLNYKILKLKGLLDLNINFNTPITKKGSKSRMGKGKGSIDCFMSYIHTNDIIFKLHNVSYSIANLILKKINFKLGIKLHMEMVS